MALANLAKYQLRCSSGIECDANGYVVTSHANLLPGVVLEQIGTGKKGQASFYISNLMKLPSSVFLGMFVLSALVACAGAHGTWSKSDLGAWANLDQRVGSYEVNHYVSEWGEPVSRKEERRDDGNGEFISGEQLLWLWKPDGTGPSDQAGLGWELILSFNERGRFQRWRVEDYRTTLTVPQIVSVARKFEYQVREEMLGELGLRYVQHGIAKDRFNFPSSNAFTRELDALEEKHSSRPRWRGWTINRLQNVVRFITEVTFRADNAARNLHERLATDDEIVGWLEEQRSKSPDSGNHPVRRPTTAHGQSGFLGRGFLEPYTPNAYGPGMNADATGRPFMWRPDFGGPALGPITPNAYGPGVGMDATGRPVRPACPPGWAGPC